MNLSYLFAYLYQKLIIRNCKKIVLTTKEHGNLETFAYIMKDKEIAKKLMFKSCENGIIEIVQTLLLHGFNPNEKDKYNNTLLQIAIQKRNINIVKLLLSNQKINPNIKRKEYNGLAPFTIATDKYFNLFNTLAYEEEVDDTTKILEQHMVEYFEIIKLLLNNPKVYPDVEYNEYTSLNHASILGCTDLVKLLLSNSKIKPNIINIYNTPLHEASWYGHIEIVKLLLADSRVNPNIKNEYNRNTALHNAVEQNHSEIVKLLLDNPKVNVNIINVYGNTPLQCAIKNKHTEIISLFEE